MRAKIIKPTKQETLRFGRRTFMRRIALATGGAAFCLPNLIINPVYAGTALIVDSSGDKRISLANAAFARAFDIGSWTTMRLGLRLMNTGTATTESVTPRLIVGLQSGASDLVLDASSTNFFGCRTTSTVWTFTDSTDDYMTGTLDVAVKKVGSSWTNSGIATSRYFHSTNSSATKNAMLLLQIEKGSPNWSTQIIVASAATLTDVTRATLLAKMTDVTLTAPTGHTLTTEQTLAFDEVAGTLNHVAVGWDRPEFAFHISDIAVSRVVV